MTEAGTPEPTGSGTTRVLAQGTFDILHTGHVHYLREAAACGDELYVIVARSDNVTHKEKPVLPDRQRRDLIAALEMVDHALVGHPEDIFVPVVEIDPDVIVLGHDQFHDERAIEEELAKRGVDCEVRRATGKEPEYEDEILSTGDIIEQICEKRCE